jgi:hypothetical protein
VRGVLHTSGHFRPPSPSKGCRTDHMCGRTVAHPGAPFLSPSPERVHPRGCTGCFRVEAPDLEVTETPCATTDANNRAPPPMRRDEGTRSAQSSTREEKIPKICPSKSKVRLYAVRAVRAVGGRLSHVPALRSFRVGAKLAVRRHCPGHRFCAYIDRIRYAVRPGRLHSGLSHGSHRTDFFECRHREVRFFRFAGL